MNEDQENMALTQALRSNTEYHGAPDTLRRAIALQIEHAAQPESRAARWHFSWPASSGLRLAGAFALGVVATFVAIKIVAPGAPQAGEATFVALAADHARALVTNSEIEVVSSDRHTVKPWISKELGVSPTVIDFRDQGFALRGGRRGYLQGTPVAVLVYSYKEHMIDLYALPAAGRADDASKHVTIDGFHCEAATKDGFVLVAVSDVDQARLDQFMALLRSPPPAAPE